MLSDNPYAWNGRAHMLYVDSPAGAGLSYSEDKGACSMAVARLLARPCTESCTLTQATM